MYLSLPPYEEMTVLPGVSLVSALSCDPLLLRPTRDPLGVPHPATLISEMAPDYYPLTLALGV